jgi:flagellar protein FlgJ
VARVEQPGKVVEKAPVDALGGNPEQFIEALWPVASEAAARLNLQPDALLAQAALETGWGKHVMKRGYGSSHNLFGIKADQRWDGDKVQVSTLEYKDGVALKTRAAFRSYGSFADSFNDYVEFVSSNPRYAGALAASGDAKAYFRELQQAGYATDPAYAEKIARILDSEPMRAARNQFNQEANAG